MQRRCGCDWLAVQLTWFGTSLHSTAGIGQSEHPGARTQEICEVQRRLLRRHSRRISWRSVMRLRVSVDALGSLIARVEA